MIYLLTKTKIKNFDTENNNYITTKACGHSIHCVHEKSNPLYKLS